ncbi:hypothetical protein BDV06DRAFT_222887 [Aspergillus oleicola]
MSLDLKLEDFVIPADIEKPGDNTNVPAKSTGILSSIKNSITKSRSLTTAQLKLAALIKELSKADKFIHKPNAKGMRITCCELVMILRDWYNGPNDEDAQEWPNLSAFFAHLNAARIQSDTNLFAVWAMRDAFEKEPEKVFTFSGEKDQCIIAAAQYILWNGQNLLKATQYNDDTDEDDLRRWNKGDLYDGEAGLTLRRWRFWKAGFHAARKDSGLGDEASDVARRAASLMEALEGSMLF